ncbi:hypothetical protein SAMN05444158_6068 [Bradyrhizobium canariense]|uniref:Uncharacterized protein n=1 Tax=Bradyrhizobium canariense TaxID=255045 RepID=A0A1H2ADG4_9BRAD|nr:hypothetical protein SAMN05444158_6068 [Bradyrhizobium canariense]
MSVAAARRHASIRAVLRPRGSNRRWSADQTRVRGGYSGGEWPRPSSQKSFRGRARPAETAKSGWKTAAVSPVKHLAAQAAINTHLSQPIGAGAFDGQQGMSFAISSGMADADISSAIAGSEVMPAMTGRENGANASPAIMKIASSRRMVIWRFTSTKSHRRARIDSPPRLTTP